MECRDGYLYCIDPSGALLWRWKTPPYPFALHQTGDGSFGEIGELDEAATTNAPADREKRASELPTSYPYRVQALSDRVLVLSWGTLYALDVYGNLLWSNRFSQTGREGTETVSGSVRDVSDEIVVSIDFSSQVGPGVVDLACSGDRIYADTSDGRLLQFDTAGRPIREQVLSRASWAEYVDHIVVAPEGGFGAVLCAGRLMTFDHGQVTDTHHVIDHASTLALLGREILVHGKRRLDLYDATGTPVWSADFGRPLADVIVRGDVIVWAGSLVGAFRRAI